MTNYFIEEEVIRGRESAGNGGGFVYLPAAVSRGPSHIRNIAIGSAGQNISGDAICVGGSTCDDVGRLGPLEQAVRSKLIKQCPAYRNSP